MDRKSSKLSPEATLRVFDAIRRKITAAKERVYVDSVSDHLLMLRPMLLNFGVWDIVLRSTHSRIVRAVYLFH